MRRTLAFAFPTLTAALSIAALGALCGACSSIDVPKYSGSTPKDSKGAFDHKELDAVLKKYVDKTGRVDYGALRIDHSGIDRYLGQLAETSPENDKSIFPTRKHQMAYWVNAYNACVIKQVVERNITDSVADTIFAESNFFRRHTYQIGGIAMNLLEIEDKANDFNEARTLFVLSRASFGSPRLLPTAITAENCEKLMEDAAVEFCNDVKNVEVSKGSTSVTLSKLFSWRSELFESYARVRGVSNANVRDAINLWRAKDAKLPINGENLWRDFDWALNKPAGGPVEASAKK